MPEIVLSTIHQRVRAQWYYPVHFTTGLLGLGNPLLRDALAGQRGPARALFVLDGGMLEHHPDLPARLAAYAEVHHEALELAAPPLVLPGGETVKRENDHVQRVLAAVDAAAIDRHSFVVAVGGGALLDAVGFAAATAHRGVRLVRVPTTVLSQNDSAVGVKNGVNLFGKKNFLGSFAPPFAVLNDLEFLPTLEDRDWLGGTSEAIKVALIKDRAFFESLERDAGALRTRDLGAMARLVHRCAELHLEHIAGGDPFEMGSARPLDFGHWAAHKLESLTDHRLRHGEAVAIGIALDATYSMLSGLLDEPGWRRVVSLLQALGLPLHAPELEAHLGDPDHPRSLLRGLEEFREHLGGRLTVTLLEGIGRGVERHVMNDELVRRSVATLATLERARPAGLVPAA